MAATPSVPIDACGRNRLAPAAGRSPAHAPVDSGQRGRQVRLVLFGVLWGIVITGTTIPSLPFAATTARPLSTLLLLQSLQWSLGGLMLSLALWLSTHDEVRWVRLACLLLLVAAINGPLSVGQSLLLRWLLGYGVSEPMMGQPLPSTSVILYSAWITLIYGSVAALIYALRRRIDQTTAALQGLSLARERNEAALAEARVSAMVERIEPSFLLEVMSTARRQYLGQAEQAEATLNACTEFLRAAMPQLRSGQSTVAAELELAATYLALRDCMAGRAPGGLAARRTGSGRDPAGLDPDDVPMPPMTLLPILERLLAGQPDDDCAAIAIDVSVDPASIVIDVGAARRSPRPRPADDAFDPEWLAALATRLTRVCGPNASIRACTSDDTGPTLRLVAPRGDDLHRS